MQKNVDEKDFEESKLKQKFHTWWLKQGCPGRDVALKKFKQQGKPIKNVNTTMIRFWILDFKRQNSDKELLESNVKYKFEKQKFQDKNRIDNKTFREHARVHNALREYNKALIKAISKLKPITVHHEVIKSDVIGIVHLSDLHFNELINVTGNKFDFEVAAKRLKLLAIRAKKCFKMMGISNILLAITGDLMNSDRRLDEYLNQSTNRGNATTLSFHLLEQFIVDLNENFNVLIANVSGNESRVKDEHGYSDYVATDNYDFTIENMLKIAFKNSDGIKFASGDAKEKIISIDEFGINVLILHGEGLTKDTEKSIQQKIGQYALKGKIINFVIFGHLHAARLGDFYSRCSSLPGANDYSDKGLNLAGRASQNLIMVHKSGNIDGVKVDLQYTDEIKGYEIIKELEAYNAKSADKCQKTTTVFKVVI
ncbi:MAG: hypothetical protein ACOC22_02160 [bacterium]